MLLNLLSRPESRLSLFFNKKSLGCCTRPLLCFKVCPRSVFSICLVCSALWLERRRIPDERFVLVKVGEMAGPAGLWIDCCWGHCGLLNWAPVSREGRNDRHPGRLRVPFALRARGAPEVTPTSWVKARLWAGWRWGRQKSGSCWPLIENTTVKLLEIPIISNTNPSAAAGKRLAMDKQWDVCC